MTGSPRWSAFVNVEDPTDVVWFDASARLEQVAGSAERPPSSALTLWVDGQGGRTVVALVEVAID